MNGPDQPDQAPESPAPTHWNTRRDPKKSFACPFCRSKIRFEEFVDGDAMFGLGNGYVVLCTGCRRGFLHKEWHYLKAMELLQEM